MREDQIDQAERKATLENDLQVLKERGSTFHQHGISQADETNQGRFASTGAPRVIGQTSGVATMYPAAAAHQRDPVPPEPPTGYCIDNPDLESSTVPHSPVEATSAPAGAAASPSVVAASSSTDDARERDDAGALSSSENMAARRQSQIASVNSPAADVGAGRPPNKDEGDA